MKTDPSANQDAEWLKQFDVTLPGCTLKKQVDILSLIKQVRSLVYLTRMSSGNILKFGSKLIKEKINDFFFFFSSGIQ